jgi:hypothetical protein
MCSWLVASLLMAVNGPQGPDPRALSARIDALLSERIQAAGAVAAEPADDAEFLRRASLDLIGRIPTANEVRAFLADGADHKRERLIDRLLADPQHAEHFARVWRALLLPEVETEPQLRYFVPGFEAWLALRRQANAGFDQMVREVLTVPITGPDKPPQLVLRDLKTPNPLAFIAAKNAEPDRIASSAVRLFLGIRLECAQCHNHPFDSWTQKQFWNQAAFFAGIERRGRGPFAPLTEAPDRRSIPLMESVELAPAVFLNGNEPVSQPGESLRVELAAWMTATDNAYFARAVVNRVWAQLLGTGIVEPVDDFRDSNPPTHPELLKELATQFAASGFDLTFLYRAIGYTSAYQRTSRQTHDSQSESELFARMPVKPLSGEQLFDSIALAIGHQQTASAVAQIENPDRVRREVLSIFAGAAAATDPETSVTQALALMNGSLIARATNPRTSVRLQHVVAEFPASRRSQIESLYLATLSRVPTAQESQAAAEFVEQDMSQSLCRLGDVLWTLLNSAEFRWNH